MAWRPAILATFIKRNYPIYLVKVIASYLSDRTATLSVNGVTTETDVNMGCSQGGVISPFPCAILIDDALRLPFPFIFKILAYADDLIILGASVEVVQERLQMAVWNGNPRLLRRSLPSFPS